MISCNPGGVCLYMHKIRGKKGNQSRADVEFSKTSKKDVCSIFSDVNWPHGQHDKVIIWAQLFETKDVVN